MAALSTPEDRPGCEAPADDRLLTVPEAARWMSFSPRFVWRRLEIGELRGVKIGRARRIALSELQRWIASLQNDRAAER